MNISKENSQSIKGIGIMLMIFHHCFRNGDRYAKFQVDFSPFSEGAVNSLGLYCKICVALFAVVSGYGLYYSYSKRGDLSTSRWIGKRLFTTLSGLTLIAPFLYILEIVKNGASFEDYGGTALQKGVAIIIDCLGLSGLFGTESINGAWWYMGAAAAFIVVLPLLALIIDKWGAGAMLALVVIFPRALGGYMGGTSWITFLCSFALGAALCSTKDSPLIRLPQKAAGKTLMFIILLALIVFGVWSYGRIDKKIFWEYHYLLIPLVIVMFHVNFTGKLRPVNAVLGFFGKHSLYMWLLHTVILSVFSKYVWAGKYFFIAPVIILVTSLICSIVITAGRKFTGIDKLLQKTAEKI